MSSMTQKEDDGECRELMYGMICSDLQYFHSMIMSLIIILSVIKVYFSSIMMSYSCGWTSVCVNYARKVKLMYKCG